MAQVCILELDAREAAQYMRAAAYGDADAQAELRHLFDDFDGPFSCFLCGLVFDDPLRPAVMIVNDPKDDSKNLALGICHPCNELPVLYRFGKLTKLFKRMYPGFRLHLMSSKRLVPVR